MKNLKFYSIAIAAITSLSLVSCEKEKETSVLSSLNAKTGHSDIPYFEDADAALDAIETAIAFDSLPELIAYETSQGRQSIGAISDAFYENIDPESFTDANEILSFYSHNTDLLDTTRIRGERVILPKYLSNPYRFIANADGFFAVGDRVYRLFNSGIVSTTENNYTELVALTNADINSLDTSIFHYGAASSTSSYYHPNCFYNWDTIAVRYNGIDRLVLELINYNVLFPGAMFISHSIVLSFSLKNYGLTSWLYKDAPITCQGDITVHKMDDNSNWETTTVNIYKTGYCHRMWIIAHAAARYTITSTAFYHYSSFHLTASTPDITVPMSYN